MSDKKELLKEIESLLKESDGEKLIDIYVLKYLSVEDLQNIKSNLLKKKDSVIEDNHEWLQQFKKYL